MNIKIITALFSFFIVAAINPYPADAAIAFSQTVTIKDGWNIVSTPRVLESHLFSVAETSANFDIFVLDASKPAGWATMADLGQSEFTPLYGYFIRNKTGADQTLTFNYKADVPPNERLFQKTFPSTGWYSVGVSNSSYAKPRGGSTADTNNVDPILNSLLGTFSYYGTVIDFTDTSFSFDPDSLTLADPWRAVARSPDVSNTMEINKLNDFRETKAYAIYIKQVGALYSGFQNNDPPIPLPPPPFGVDIKADNSDVPITIPNGSSATINWNSIGASSCSISPTGWTGLNGSQTTGSLTSPQIYTVTCSDGTNSISDSVIVNILPPPAISVSVTSSPVSQNVVSGVNGFHFASYNFDATASGEDIRVTSATLRNTYTESPNTNDLSGCQLFNGVAALNTGTNVINPSLDGTSPDDMTFTLDTNLNILKGTIKMVDLKCNISANAVENSTYAWGINANVPNVVVADGADSGLPVSITINSAVGQTMTIKSFGSFTVTLDSSSPTQERYAIAGKTDVLLSVLKLHANNEAIKLDRIALVLSSSTASSSDVTKVTLWDGATKVGEALFQGTNTRATSTLGTSFIVPKDGDKLLTIKGDLSLLGTNLPATRGHLVAVNHDGEAGATETDGIGQSSGTTINPSAGTNTAGGGVRMVKSYPTLERLSVSSNTLANGEMVLYRFKVTADAAGDVGLGKVSFRVSSTTVATTSVYKLYAYSDSSFSVAAYANNPVHSRNVDISGENSWNGASAVAGSIDIYFNPAGYTNPDTNAETSEAINVPAGTSRYFELRGTVASAIAGDSISVALRGDSAVANNTNLVNRENANAVAGSTGSFVWSSNSTSTSATTTDDWLNGFQLPGLPTTEMTQQTFTK